MKNLKKIPIYLDIRDILEEHKSSNAHSLKELLTEFEVSKETDHKAVIYGKEATQIREKSKNLIIKCFFLGVYYEIYHYDKLRIWRDQHYEEGSIPFFSIPPTENIRKIGDTFISLIQQFDTPDIVKISEKDQIYTIPHSPSINSEMIQYWISVIGNAILESLELKISNIQELSEQGANQLKNDAEYAISK